ncbi:hypothetical protein [Mesorhizobium shangrilense]|uniref:Porin family protein n=1 Tax=Mesorhizobium shangrilense TaxID=460060 RepID=A0ABV2D6I4_9HYPH
MADKPAVEHSKTQAAGLKGWQRQARGRYTDFGSHDFPASTLLVPLTTKLTSNDVRIGIAYKF